MSEGRHYSANSENYLWANLHNQVHRKSVKKGWEFTLMVVGESGLGKSTLINALFGSQLYRNRKVRSAEEMLSRTVEIQANTVDIEERGVKLKLTVVDGQGFGDTLDGRDNFEPIIRYIDDQFDRFLDYESGLNRRQHQDTRVHCMFYFISPIGYGLRAIDIHFMKQVHTKVNLVPIIAKCDVFTRDELTRFKKKVLADLKEHNISIYNIADADSDEEPEYKEQVQLIKASVPFAVSSSLDQLDVLRKTHGRQYGWGTVEMENPSHSDFVKLRSMLVTHMQDLREVTGDLHYENYRAARLASRKSSNTSSIINNNADNSSETSSLLDQSQMNSNKDYEIRKKEEEIAKMQEMLQKMRQQMHAHQKQTIQQ